MRKHTISLIFISQFIFLLLITSLWGGKAQAVEKIYINEDGHWIVDGFQIGMDYNCHISRSNLLPEKYCTPPLVVIRKLNNNNQNSYSFTSGYFKLLAGNIELGDSLMFRENVDPNKLAPFRDSDLSSDRSASLFNLLISKGDTQQIKFMTRAGSDSPIKTRNVILFGFQAYAEDQLNEINEQYSKQESDERRIFFFMIGLLILFVVIVLVVIRFLILKANRKIDAVKQHIETRRVSRVAEDEAIREVVRKSVQQVDEQSIEVLRNQIKTALDSGDTKTAEELFKIMNGLTRK